MIEDDLSMSLRPVKLKDIVELDHFQSSWRRRNFFHVVRPEHIRDMGCPRKLYQGTEGVQLSIVGGSNIAISADASFSENIEKSVFFLTSVGTSNVVTGCHSSAANALRRLAITIRVILKYSLNG